jgi:hypothetical protein
MTQCTHHEHDDPDDPAVWAATDRNGVPLGEYCTGHLGDALDDYEADVHLQRLDVS